MADDQITEAEVAAAARTIEYHILAPEGWAIGYGQAVACAALEAAAKVRKLAGEGDAFPHEEENLQPGVSINTDQLRLRKRWLYPIPRGRCESIFMMIDKLCDEIDALRNDRDKWHDNALAAATGRDRHA